LAGGNEKMSHKVCMKYLESRTGLNWDLFFIFEHQLQ